MIEPRCSDLTGPAQPTPPRMAYEPLADLFPTEVAARLLAARAGCRAADLPGFTTAREFWQQVWDLVAGGASPGDPRELLRQALAERPFSQELRAALGLVASPVPAPPRSSPGAVPPSVDYVPGRETRTSDRVAAPPEQGDVAAPETTSAGRILGGCELLDVVGTGAMGRVYRARHLRLERDVAVKVILPRAALEPRALARFRREAAIAARIDHPNVVRVLDAGEEEGGVHYIVQELVEGVTLDERTREVGPLPLDEVARLGEDLASGLAAIHAAGIVHRDLKPANVIVTPDGRAKLLDFGLARVLEDDARLTHDSAVVGTPLFLAPEQLVDRTRVGPPADLYALGGTLFHALTGRAPFQPGPGDPVVALLARRTVTPAPDVRSLRPDAPAPLAALIAALLAIEPADRPAAAEAAECLARGIRGCVNQALEPDVCGKPEEHSMTEGAQKVDLHAPANALARRYGSRNEIEFLLSRADVATVLIPDVADPLQRWWQILQRTTPEQLLRILEVARADYPRDEFPGSGPNGSEEVGTAVSVPIMGSSLRDLLAFLASAYGDQGGVRHLCTLSGQTYSPPNESDPGRMWSTVYEHSQRGRLDFRALLREAAHEYPRNEVLRRYLADS